MQAKLRFPPQPYLAPRKMLRDEDGALVRDGAGYPVAGDAEVVTDEHGAPVLLPSPVDRLTEEDWQAAGGKYVIPREPSTPELTAAMLDIALDIAEDAVYRLLALFTMSNRELSSARKAGTLDDVLRTAVDDLLDEAGVDELVDLTASVGELIDGHLIRKARDIGPRLDPFLSLLGIERAPRSPTSAPTSAPASSTPETTTAEHSSSRPSSSTASPASTPDGPPTPSSTPPTTSSSSSAGSSTSTPERPIEPEFSPTPIADRPQA